MRILEIDIWSHFHAPLAKYRQIGRFLETLAHNLAHRVRVSLRASLAVPYRWGDRVYAIGAVVALYLNVFVLVVQAFLKSPALNALAPTQSEPPFLVAQLFVLMLFVGFGIVAARRFRHPV